MVKSMKEEKKLLKKLRKEWAKSGSELSFDEWLMLDYKK